MGMNLLHFAAMNKNPKNCKIIDILLKKGMDVNSKADDKTTPLHYACATGLRFSSISVFQIYSLCFYISNRLKSVFLGNPDMVKMLLEKGASENINLKDSVGDTPLMYATFGAAQGNRESKYFDSNDTNVKIVRIQ